METYLSVERAEQLLLEHTAAPGEFEELPLLDALGRAAYCTMTASIDQPPFNRSPLDGFAINHADISTASHDEPVSLRVTQTIFSGDSPGAPMSDGEAVKIMTGAPLPPDATCVIRQEDVDFDGKTVKIYTPLTKYENFCFKGEDIKRGTVLVEKGERFSPAHIGILAGQGYESVIAYRRPRVCILSTGSELSAQGKDLGPGKIYDSNRLTLSARAAEIGAQVIPGGCIEDNPDKISSAINSALPGCDIIITTGGVSVGDKDYMPEVVKAIGAEVIFKGISAKPGSPVLAAKKDSKIILCLSGNPFASYVVFELLAVPAIRGLAGENCVLPRRVKGVIRSAFNKESRGRRFIRAKMEGGDVYIPESGHSSGMLYTLSGCNCLIDIPAGNRGLKDGDTVEVLMF